MDENTPPDLDVLTTIIGALKRLKADEQLRTLQAVSMFLGHGLAFQTQQPPGLSQYRTSASNEELSNSAVGSFSEDRKQSAKEFLRDKKPTSDVERVACLAYYLTHYRDTPHFKTLEISTLNTEAAQPKFSNASMAVDNATKAGILVQALKGSKQLSSAGEHYVQLLPDREAAREAFKSMNLRRRTPNAKRKKATPALSQAPTVVKEA